MKAAPILQQLIGQVGRFFRLDQMPSFGTFEIHHQEFLAKLDRFEDYREEGMHTVEVVGVENGHLVVALRR